MKLYLVLAQFEAQQAQFVAEHAILEKERIRVQKSLDKRFRRIEALLLRRGQLLIDLPHAVLKKTSRVRALTSEASRQSC